MAELFKVLGSTTRLSLIEILMTSPATVGELVSGSGLSQPLVSQHLRTLRQVGVVSASAEGARSSTRWLTTTWFTSCRTPSPT